MRMMTERQQLSKYLNFEMTQIMTSSRLYDTIGLIIGFYMMFEMSADTKLQDRLGRSM
jgi:hypothetical protein